MRLKALKSWFNAEHEGAVEEGHEFEASEYRANELVRIGLAMAVVGETEKIKVPSDRPAPAKADTPPKQEEPQAPPQPDERHGEPHAPPAQEPRGGPFRKASRHPDR
jgi:hypothetical protein